MSSPRLLGGVLLIAGACAYLLIFRSIAWMVYGGLRDYLQLAGLLLSAATALRGAWMLCCPARRPVLRDSP